MVSNIEHSAQLISDHLSGYLSLWESFLLFLWSVCMLCRNLATRLSVWVGGQFLHSINRTTYDSKVISEESVAGNMDVQPSKCTNTVSSSSPAYSKSQSQVSISSQLVPGLADSLVIGLSYLLI
jgi:hypothetical protein